MVELCICGAVRNCGHFLPRIFKNMEKIGSLFQDYVIILYYDVSHDNTLNMLKNYQKQNPRLKFYVNQSPLSEHRTVRLANARNGCLKMMRQTYPSVPYHIMMDCDDVCANDINLDILKWYIHHSGNWDCLTFNKPDYYDIWALSIKPYFISYRHFQNENKMLGDMKSYITGLLKQLPPKNLLKCASAFNGFAIYKTAKFRGCFYCGVQRADLIPREQMANNILMSHSAMMIRGPGNEQSILDECEHRPFHLEAIQKHNARIRIAGEILF